MAREIETWITMNGQHIPIYKVESKQDAVNRAIANKNEDTKEKQIARNKAESDRLNGKDVIKHEHPSNTKSDDLEERIQKRYKQEYERRKKDGYFTPMYKKRDEIMTMIQVVRQEMAQAKQDGDEAAYKKLAEHYKELRHQLRNA